MLYAALLETQIKLDHKFTANQSKTPTIMMTGEKLSKGHLYLIEALNLQ